jgi:hypothetical protein
MSYFEKGKLKYDDELGKAVPEYIICEGTAICDRIVVKFLALPGMRVNSELKINGDMYVVMRRIDNQLDNKSVIYVRPKEAPPEWAETHQGS